jgi:CheY-like chemotaxis protein
MINELQILHLEDDPVDAELISQTLLIEFPNCSIIKVETQGEFEKVLRSNKFDLILSDFSLPGFDGLSKCK